MEVFTPTVFAVGQSYQIMAKAPQPSLFWVQPLAAVQAFGEFDLLISNGDYRLGKRL